MRRSCATTKVHATHPHTLNPTPYTLHPQPYTLHPQPSNPNTKLQTPNPKPQTPNATARDRVGRAVRRERSEPYTLHPQPYTLNSNLGIVEDMASGEGESALVPPDAQLKLVAPPVDERRADRIRSRPIFSPCLQGYLAHKIPPSRLGQP